MRTTILSSDREYRYVLWREWDRITPGLKHAVFIGLNGSTADELHDDPTIRRCVGFAKEWGFCALAMVNLFAFRTLDPKVLKAQNNPVGINNDSYIIEVTAHAGITIAAWGTHGGFMGRDKEVMRLFRLGALHCLGRTKDGFPRHPLYIKKTQAPEVYQ